LPIGLFPLSLHVHAWSEDIWSEGTTFLSASNKGKDASKKMQAQKR